MHCGKNCLSHGKFLLNSTFFLLFLKAEEVPVKNNKGYFTVMFIYGIL
jgi:hypothetical protein